jgi:hypothetical protein
MPRPTGIARQAYAARDARTGPQRGKQLQDRRRAWKIARFLDINPRVTVALVTFSVRVAFKVGEGQSGPAWHYAPHGDAGELRAQWCEQRPRPFECLLQFRPRAANHQAYRLLSVSVSMNGPLAQHAVSLAAAACPTKENLKDRAGQQRRLRAFLRLPNYAWG